jgi:hypothetical protein
MMPTPKTTNQMTKSAPDPTESVAPRPRALELLDALDQAEHDAEAARQRKRVDERRKAALEDARAILEEWQGFVADIAWPRPPAAGHPECDRILSPMFNQQVLDTMVLMYGGIVENARQHVARLSAVILELDGLDPATGAARVEQLGAAVRAESAALVSAYDDRASWYTARRKMLPEAQALVTIGQAIAAWFAVPTPAPSGHPPKAA